MQDLEHKSEAKEREIKNSKDSIIRMDEEMRALATEMRELKD